jgi:phytoene desaturase
MNKKVAIIGAGLTGLSAGITLEKHGVKTIIYEKAPWAGGVCTAWKRKGYTFDGCIHWMIGTNKREPMRKMYEDVHALEKETSIFHMEKLYIETEDTTYEIPLDITEFKKLLLEIAPEDSKGIHHLCKEIKKVSRSELIAGKPTSLKAYLHAVTRARGFLFTIMKYVDMTVESYCKRFKNEKLLKIVYHLMPPSFTMFALITMLGTRMAQNGGFPMGGARDMIDRMKNHYIALGGEIKFNTQITKIVVSEQNAIEVKSNQEVFPVSHVIAACDLYDTLHNMLDGSYPHPVLNRMLNEIPLFDTIMLISLGLELSFNIPYSATYRFDSKFNVGGKTYVDQYHIRSFDFDSSFAPKGGSSVMITLLAPFDYWHKLRNENFTTYNEAKNNVAKRLIEQLEKRYPGISQAVKVVDVATPSTYYRLNNLHKGSFEGFLPIPQALNEKIDKQISGINNLYLAGQWVTPGGGIPPAIMSGIETAKLILKSYKKSKKKANLR